MVFDHWKVSEFFRVITISPASRPTINRLFSAYLESRIAFAETALNKPTLAAFDVAVQLLSKDIADLSDKTIAECDKWRQVQKPEKSATPETVRARHARSAPSGHRPS